MVLRLPKRLRDPFTALLLFGAAGIVAMILAFAITALPRLGGPAAPIAGSNQQQPASPSPDLSPSPTRPEPKPPKGHGHGGDHGG